MNNKPVIALLAALCSSLAACQGSSQAGTCSQDSDCLDPALVCTNGLCTLPVGTGFSFSPNQVQLSATIGGGSTSAQSVLSYGSTVAVSYTVGCNNGVTATPAQGSVSKVASVNLTIQASPMAAPGTVTAICQVSSQQDPTANAELQVLLTTSNAAGGGSGGGSAGGSGGGSAGGSGGGSAGGSGGGSAGGSGGGSAGGSGGGSAGGSGGGSAGGSGGGSAGGSGGGSAGGSGGGSAGGSGGGSGGSSGSGVGPTGGTVDHLYFAVVGDSRPADADELTSYPSAIISKIHQDIEGLNPQPQFVVSTGDYMYANTSPAVSGSAQTQAQDYLSAAAAWTGTFFPAMGNHECDGYVADNCTSTTQYPNITAFTGTILKAAGQSSPYYSIPINATDKSWTAKLVVVACNYWSTTQQTWLTSQLATSTTYTILVRHENADATSTPPCFPTVPNLMASAKYDLSLVGHVHDFSASSSSKEVVVGHGGAPLTSSYSGTYGFVTVEQLSTGWQIKNYDYATDLPVTTVTIPLQ